MSKKIRTRLLYCPVCGQKPKSTQKGEEWYASCDGYIHSEDGIRIPTHNLSVGPFSSTEKAAKAWNRLIQSTSEKK